MEHHQELEGVAGNNTNTKISSSCYNNMCSGGGGGGGSGSSSSSRQSSTRWSPTSEQIRILKELYYNNGVRSPTAEQIQRISAKLRQYGKIEGKNVFYWFQNHKARERQKKRFTTTATTTTSNAHHDMMMISSRPPLPPQPLPNYRYHHPQPDNHHLYYNKFTPGGLINVGSYSGYGSIDIGQQQQQPLHPSPHNFTWAGFHEPYIYAADQTLEMEMEEEELEREEEEEGRETLPLFPIHGDTIKQQTNSSSSSDYNGYNNSSSNYFSATSSRASLELSLSSSYSVSRFHTTIN